MAGEAVAQYKDALLVLATAAVVVPVVRRLNVSPILGFLVAGVALGPHGAGRLATQLPLLGHVTVGSPEAVAAVAEIGIVFLLFLIGLELSFERLQLMRRLVFGLGTLQVVLTAGVLALGAVLLGWPVPVAAVFALALALSSTAIVIEVLSRQRRLTSTTGRVSFAILLLQDLAVVPIILMVGMLAAGPGDGGIAGVALGLLQGGAILLGLVLLGRRVLRPLFGLVVSAESPDLFIAAAVLVAVGTGVITASFGLSMALGAFIAGLLLAETEYRRAIETVLDPFKSLLLGVFFFSVGMKIDLAVLIARPGALLALVALLLAIKGALLVPLVRAFRFDGRTAFRIALLLAPAGEFAFVVLSLAERGSLISREDASLALTAAALTMALIPILDALGQRLEGRVRGPDRAPDPALSLPPEDHAQRALVIGGGRVGQLVSDMLAHRDLPHLIIDRDPGLVAALRRAGRVAYVGDARQAAFLDRCGLREASAVIITTDQPRDIESMVEAARALQPNVPIIARARDAAHARLLYRLGVAQAVPETIEASLQMSEAALVTLGVPMGHVLADIHDRRDAFRKELGAAARDRTTGTGAANAPAPQTTPGP